MKDLWKSLGAGAASIILLTVVAYLPAVRGGFIWDDIDYLIVNNPRMLSVEGLKQIWTSLEASHFIPLTLTSFWVEHHFWGLNPLPYHSINIALQGVNAVLLWRLLRRLQVRGAWVAAVLWALHPVNVESVAWVAELKNTQSGLFFLLALLMFLRFEDQLCPRDYVLALVCGAAAMLSKSSTVVLPGVILLCAWWRRGRWTRKDLLRVTPFVVFGIAMSLVTIAEQRFNVTNTIESTGASEWALTAGQRFVLAGRAVWFYAGKLLWPADICFFYPRWELRVDSAAAWLSLAGLALVAGTLWHFRRASWARAAIFGLGYFIIALLPVLGFFDIFFFRFTFVSDHFQYLASMGLIALAVSAGATIAQRAGQRGRDLGTLAAATVLLVLGASSWTRAHAYRDAETLWRDTLEKNPQCWEGHNNLARILLETGRRQEAVWHCEQVLRLMPNDFEAPYMLGVALLGLGNAREAVRCFETAIRLAPSLTDAHNRLGAALLQLNRVPEAVRQFKLAVWIRPDWALMQNNLGYALARAGKFDEAIKHYQQALRIEPDSAEVYNNLAFAFLGKGKVQEAIGQYRQALRIKPNYPQVHNNLGLALFQLGNVPDAIEQFEQAIRVQPDFIDAQRNLAWLLATIAPAEGGDPARAVTLAGRACELTSNRVPAYLDTLAATYASAGRFDDAIATADKALGLARSAGQSQLVGEIEARLELYRSGRPYRQTRTPVQSQPVDSSRSDQ